MSGPIEFIFDYLTCTEKLNIKTAARNIFILASAAIFLSGTPYLAHAGNYVAPELRSDRNFYPPDDAAKFWEPLQAPPYGYDSTSILPISFKGSIKYYGSYQGILVTRRIYRGHPALAKYFVPGYDTKEYSGTYSLTLTFDGDNVTLSTSSTGVYDIIPITVKGRRHGDVCEFPHDNTALVAYCGKNVFIGNYISVDQNQPHEELRMEAYASPEIRKIYNRQTTRESFNSNYKYIGQLECGNISEPMWIGFGSDPFAGNAGLDEGRLVYNFPNDRDRNRPAFMNTEIFELAYGRNGRAMLISKDVENKRVVGTIQIVVSPDGKYVVGETQSSLCPKFTAVATPPSYQVSPESLRIAGEIVFEAVMANRREHDWTVSHCDTSRPNAIADEDRERCRQDGAYVR